jgi:hypothetical protein
LLPSFASVASEPSTHVKWKKRGTVAVSRPETLDWDLSILTGAFRTLETASTPGVRAIAAAAPGENESQPDVVVRM